MALLGAGAALGLPGCCSKPPPVTAAGWKNAVGTRLLDPELVAFPSNAKDIVALVKAAETAEKRVRMTGSGHSFSDAALNEDYLLLPNRLDSVLTLDQTRLKPEHANDKTLLRVQSGATIRKLNEELDRRELAFQNLGGYDAQTIAGVAMTATHGSGLEFGPIASQIVSLQVVASDGAVWQIEPTNGITRRDGFPKPLEEDPSVLVNLKQDDQWFNAAVVSMGCMGVVYAVVLKATPRFWLKERRKLVPWASVSGPGGYIDTLIRENRPPADAQLGSPDYYEIYVNPYQTRMFGVPDHPCLVTERWRLSEPPPVTPQNSQRGIFGSGNILADPAAKGFTEHALRATLDGARNDFLHTFHDVLLLALDDDDYVDKSYDVFNLGRANELRAYGIEVGFPIEQTVAIMNSLFAIARQQEAKQYNHSVPVSLRFVKAADAYLAMQQGRRTTMLEIGMLVGARGAGELLLDYEKQFIARFKARPHWGLDLDVLQGKDSVAALYPEFPKWLAVYDQLNEKGTFDGKLTDRLGISKRPRDVAERDA